jgi:hypothetical protein
LAFNHPEPRTRTLPSPPPPPAIAVPRCAGLLPDGEAGPRRRRPCLGVQPDAWRVSVPGSAWMCFFPGLNLSPCFSPLFTKPLRTFGFSDHEVRVTVPPLAWSMAKTN